jgi:hypothetical protein
MYDNQDNFMTHPMILPRNKRETKVRYIDPHSKPTSPPPPKKKKRKSKESQDITYSLSFFIYSFFHIFRKNYIYIYIKKKIMDYGRIVFAIVGISASFFLCVPILQRWHRQQITAEKLRLISEALEHAEDRVQRFQERHDRILSQICTYYLINKELEEALAGARAAMNEAMEFAVNLRRMQMKIITSFPEEVLDHQGEGSNIIPIHYI